jgi:von Willebrand factor
MCSCETEPSSCFCPILASYAQECAAHNVALNWRRDVRECGTKSKRLLCRRPQQFGKRVMFCPGVQCPAGQTFQTCGDFCSHSCSDISLHETCSQRCVEGCNCPQGQTLDKNGDCVPISQCPCLHQGREYEPGAKEFRNDANDSLQLW